MTSLIDHVMPAWDFRERHRRHIPASPESAYAALPRVDLARSPIIAPLLALRSLPSRLRSSGVRLRAGRLGDFFGSGFVRLIDDCPHGLVLGSIGQFWRSSNAIRGFEPGEFASNRAAGCARLAWCFEFAPREGGCLATTETRIACNDASAYRWMFAYWLAIRPASGLIRREILRLLARDCSCAA